MLNLGIMSKFPKQFQKAGSMRNGAEDVFGNIWLFLLGFRFVRVITLVIKATREKIILQNHLVSSVVPRIV